MSPSARSFYVAVVAFCSDDSEYEEESGREDWMPDEVSLCGFRKNTYHVLTGMPYPQARALIGQMRASRSQSEVVHHGMSVGGLHLVQTGVSMCFEIWPGSPQALQTWCQSHREVHMILEASGRREVSHQSPEWHLHNHLRKPHLPYGRYLFGPNSYKCDICDNLRCLERRDEDIRLFQVVHHAKSATEIAPMRPSGSVAAPSLFGRPTTDESHTVIDQVPEIDSPVAEIDPAEAAVVCEQQWATAVEFLNARGSATTATSTNVAVVVLTFNRDQHAFDEVLLHSDLAVRAQSAGCCLQHPWGNGEKISVPEITAADVQDAHVELLPRHVVAYEKDVQEVLGLLDALPSHLRPRLKPKHPIVDVPLGGSLAKFGELTTFPSSSKSSRSIREIVVPTSAVPQMLPIKWTFIHFEADGELHRPQSTRSV